MFTFILYSLCLLAAVIWIDSAEGSSNLLIIRKATGRELEDWMKRFSWGAKQDLRTFPVIPEYKFYSSVIEVLLSIARKFGGSYQEAFLFLREGLQADLQFEKKLKELILGTWFQMGLMMLLTWSFIVGALSLVDVKISFMKLGCIGIWQGIGLGLLPLILKKQREKFFGDIGRVWKILYILRSLARVPLARSEVFEFANLHELKDLTQKNLFPLREKLQDVCRESLKQGGHYEEGVKSLMDELRFQEKWHFELFEKRLSAIKLGLISLFFLPSYLAFIFLLLSDLMKIL